MEIILIWKRCCIASFPCYFASQVLEGSRNSPITWGFIFYFRRRSDCALVWELGFLCSSTLGVAEQQFWWDQVSRSQCESWWKLSEGVEKYQCWCPSLFLKHLSTLYLHLEAEIAGEDLFSKHTSFPVSIAVLFLSLETEITGIAFLSQNRERLLIPFLALQIMDFLLSLLTMFSSYIQVPAIVSVSSLSHMVGHSSLSGWSLGSSMGWMPTQNVGVQGHCPGPQLFMEVDPTLAAGRVQFLGVRGSTRKSSDSWDSV